MIVIVSSISTHSLTNGKRTRSRVLDTRIFSTSFPGTGVKEDNVFK